MPCLGPSDAEIAAMERNAQRAQAEARFKALPSAVLCAVLTVLEKNGVLKDVISEIDYTEAGFTRTELTRWWKDHKAEDEKRRKREAEAREREQLRQDALKKLTPAERRALDLDK